MDSKTVSKRERYTTFVKDETEYIGVPTGITGSHHALKAITNLKNEPGWIIRGNTIEEWRFLGFTRIDEEVCMYGPLIEGKALDEVLELPAEQSLPFIANLTRALGLLRERSFELFSFELDGVLFLEGGGVFFFPRPTMSKVRDSRSEDYRLNSYEVVNHPYLKGEERASFTVAILLYRILTGRYPFVDENVDAIRSKIRSLNVVSPLFVQPELRKEVSDILVHHFDKSETYSLEDWQRIIAEWIQEGTRRVITTREREELLAKAREQSERSEKAFKKRIFWEKNGRFVLIMAAVTIVVGFVVGSFVKNALAPRVTKGYTPEQVIDAFYKSLNTLDHITMEDCVIKGAGKTEINETIHLYVISKQTMAYEGKSYIVPADVWDSDGRPDVDPPFFVYGVTNLELRRTRGGEEPVYVASYQRWARKPVEDVQTADSLYEGYLVQDRLFMKQNKGDWVIFHIERLNMKPIE